MNERIYVGGRLEKLERKSKIKVNFKCLIKEKIL